MGTLNLTSPALPPYPATGDPLTPSTAPPSASDCPSGEFAGRMWTYRPEAVPLLTAVPANVWSDPQANGGEQVKRNARREVWRMGWHGEAYFLKYYYRDSWLRRARVLFRAPACIAEWEGGLYAQRAGIPAVRPLAYTLEVPRGRRRCALLISKAIEPAQALSEFWQPIETDDDTRRQRRDVAQLTELLAELIARAHQAGFEHLDMHAANILVQPVSPGRYRTFLVDLQSARRGAPLTDRAVVRNLAQLNQWFRRHSSVGGRLRFLRAYLRWRNEFETVYPHGRPLGLTFPQLVATLKTAARHHAERLWAQRDRRLSRTGRYFARIRLPGAWRGMVVLRSKHPTDESRASRLEFDRDWWRRQLSNPLRWFDEDSSTSCKNSHSAAVRRALLEHEHAPLPVIIKRPRARNWRRRLAQLWPPSRSLRGWRMGHALLHRHLPTARPLATLERRIGPLVLDSILITEAIPGAADLDTFLRTEYSRRSAGDWHRLKRELSHLLAQQLRRLLQRGLRHRDCKASNILVVQHPRLKVLWIDMDGLRLAGPCSRNDGLRPLVRLQVSLADVPGLSRTDWVRFLRSYFAGYGQSPAAWRAAWPALQAASVEKSRAKAARRAWKLKHYGRE